MKIQRWSMKTLMGIALIAVATLLVAGCDDGQRRQQIMQDFRTLQMQQMERMQESFQRILENQRANERIMESMREAEGNRCHPYIGVIGATHILG